MKNKDKYRFEDFTTDNYRKCLRIAKKHHVFRTFSNFKPDENFIIWRHDVDFSMHRALKLAQLEAEEGIQSTFYVLLHSEFYNLLEKEVSDLVLKIIALGHEIGLHFDSHFKNISNESKLEKELLFEKTILENVFPVTIRSFCFHINNTFTLNCNNSHYAGLLNAYSAYFQKEVAYCSDSNGYWRFTRLEEFLIDPKNKRCQVLTHPELWQDEVMSPRQRVYRSIEMRAEKTKRWYNHALEINNRPNIDWD